MPKQPNPDDESGSTSIEIDDAPGATAFVRLDQGGELPPPPRRAPAPSAPKKGLQVQLPDDEPAPAPKPKPKPVAAAAPQGKGRRGAWWDEQSAHSGDDEAPPEEAAAEEEPPAETADDAPGATAFLKAPPPPPPVRRKAPAPPPEPEPAPRAPPPPAGDAATQFFKPDQVVLDADVHERPLQAPVEAAVPWKLILSLVAAAALITVLSIVLVYRKDIFHSRHHPAKSAGQTDDTTGE